MGLTRNEVGNMREVALQLTADRLRYSISEDWRRGQSGKLSEIYDLALVYAECAVRGIALPEPMLLGQLRLDTDESGCTRLRTLQ